MSLGLPAAATLQTFFVVAFLLVLMPFRLPQRKMVILIGGIMMVLCVTTGVLAAIYGLDFLAKHGYTIIGLPLYCTVYIFSRAKGSRFLFVVMTTFIFHRIVSILLTALRVASGGYTPLYFLMNFLMFGAMLFGASRLRTDFHKIVFGYQKEFGCLSIMLILLLILVWIFSPVTHRNRIDKDIFMVAMLLYLIVLTLYLYIGISFRSFSQRLDAERNALSLGHQMRAAQDNIMLMQATQNKTKQYHQELSHHLLCINALVEQGKMEELQSYLLQVAKDVETITPKRYCDNEVANLILTSVITQIKPLGICLEIAAELPQCLPIGDTEFCTLLANGLENAIIATVQVEDGREKTIRLSTGMADGKLLLLIENPYTGTVRIANGLPQSDHKGLGFGTKSMEAIAEKYGGLSSFEAHDGVFTVRIVL